MKKLNMLWRRVVCSYASFSSNSRTRFLIHPPISFLLPQLTLLCIINCYGRVRD